MDRSHSGDPGIPRVDALYGCVKRTGNWFVGFIFVVLGTLVYSAPVQAVDQVAIASFAYFKSGQPMPPRFARTHDNISPPFFLFEKAYGPSSIKSFVLIMDDPDAPSGLFTHWLVWNIPLDHPVLPEGGVPPGSVQGTNSFGDAHYDGPAPPNGKHRYFFHLYGLDTMLSLPPGSDRNALEVAMKGHIVAKATDFYGTFATGQ